MMLQPVVRNGSVRAMNISMDVWENENTYFVEAELPGFKKEDIQVNIHDNMVTLSVEAKEEKQAETDRRQLLAERQYGTRTRSVTLGSEIDQEQAQAKYEDGVLHLTLPKAAHAKPKQLIIN